MKRAEKKTHLLDVAATLFNQYGYRAVGVDQVIEVSGIAKTTLYRHFRTKDELIVAVLNRVDERFRSEMAAFVDTQADAPAQKLLATFDYLSAWFGERTFYGCPFINAAGEYSDRTCAVFQAAVAHKQAMVAYFEGLCRAAKLSSPKRLAEHINLLHEGAIAVAHITGDAKPARKAKDAARLLIEAAAG